MDGVKKYERERERSGRIIEERDAPYTSLPYNFHIHLMKTKAQDRGGRETTSHFYLHIISLGIVG